jgi:integrase
MPQTSRNPLPRSDKGILALSGPAHGRKEYPDTLEKGLYLRVTAAGSKTWIVRTRPKGSRRQVVVTLDRYPRMSLKGARVAARELLASAAAGEDPQAARRAPDRGLTVAAVSQEWLEEKLAHIRPATERQYRRIVEHDLRPFHRKDIGAVTRLELVRFHRSLAKDKPILANRVLTVMKMIFAFAADVAYREDDPASSLRRLHKETPKPRPYNDDELRTFWACTADLSPTARGVFRMRALTGCRLRTVRHMRWEDLRPGPTAAGDPRAALDPGCSTGVWVIPGRWMKSRRDFTVPITEEIAEELRHLASFTGMMGEWVFPGRPASQSVQSLSTSRRQLRRAILSVWPSFEDADFHGLRDTAVTLLESWGCPYRVIQQILDHATVGATGRYTGHRFSDEHRRWLGRWTRHLVTQESAEKGDSGGEVALA